MTTQGQIATTYKMPSYQRPVLFQEMSALPSSYLIDIQKEENEEFVLPSLTVIHTNQKDILQDPNTFETGISKQYSEYNVTNFINKVINNLESWIDVCNTQDALLYIRNIQNILSEYKEYLFQKNESRLLFGTVSLVIRESNWKNLTQQQLKVLVNELNRFKDGTVSSKNLIKALQQLYRTNINLVNQDSYEEEKKGQ